jgi:hypothetical protein
MRFTHYLLTICGCFFLLPYAGGEQMPNIASESLTGRQMMLPDSLKGRPAVVIVGFSKSSQTRVKEWDSQARKQLGAAFDVYQVAVLEDAPRFVRGMITHAMKGSTPADRQDHFLIVVQGEAELKKAVAFSESDDAYVLLLDGTGDVRWRAHGAVSDAAFRELEEQVEKLKHAA